jgi:uncharacterized protein YjbI with pentapeptide repeats
MTTATPAFAAVRPRVVVATTGDSRLLDEVIAELAEELTVGVVRVTGGGGSGKSTALDHLAAVFAQDERIIFLDEPTQDELDNCRDDVLIVATTVGSTKHGVELALEPWGQDELIEYLLNTHRDACSSVIAQVGAAANWAWTPEVACVVLERFVADGSLTDPRRALTQYIAERLTSKDQTIAAQHLCFAKLAGRAHQIEAAAIDLSEVGCPRDVLKLLRHEVVQLPLAAQYIVSAVEARDDATPLSLNLPTELIEEVGRCCQGNQAAFMRLAKLLDSRGTELVHAMAASILVAADRQWRLPKRREPWGLNGGIFRHAQWPDVDLARAMLRDCDFSGANLASSVFYEAYASSARFDDANLHRASLIRINAYDASFRRCNLERARMPNARLSKADFSDANLAEAALMKADLREANFSAASLRQADLSVAQLPGASFENANLENAVLRQANLTAADLRTVRLQGACLEKAILNSVQMEDIQMTDAILCEARLRDAHLTGSVLQNADLRRADLRGAGLAEIDWEGADLRGANLSGATFHMGSSRSGLVGSPIACEGSRTGFYTDDVEDLSFKRPEEVRKANLRGADLRGANVKNVDFYLVDLRDAQLDRAQRDQARQTGAILEDCVA